MSKNGQDVFVQLRQWSVHMIGLALIGIVLLVSWGWMPTSAVASTCTSASWVASVAYAGGDIVSHNGYEWRAKWWTQGEEPGTTGEWGVWEEVGLCDDDGTATPTSQPTTTVAVTVTTSPTNEPTVTPTETVSTCDVLAWQASVAYSGGDEVRHNGYKWRAKWWTQGEEPGTTGEWGAWEQLGSCGATPVATATPWATEEATMTPTATDEPTVVPTVTEAPTGMPTPTTIPTVTATPPTGGHDVCRPMGLYKTAGVDVPYCSVYDQNGREMMGSDHPRRIIGYFTSWRNGANGQPTYLVSDIPWGNITHINYAFAHIDDQNRLSVGNTTDPTNPATGMEWPGVVGAEMDLSLPYKGHFNLLTQYKQQYPEVKTLISVGGWAETGGYFDANGERVDNGGFFTMTTNPDGSVNRTGIEAFADSAVSFIRTYGFDGVDIDYEYPTSMMGAGNPLDFGYADALRPYLMESYAELMKTLRHRLDVAGAEDGRHYMLTVAAPSSGYLLRGMETFQVTQYLDYVNIMTYDLHGAWNEYVGHNAALYDTGLDGELAAANVYGTAQYGGIGYLNIDWAYHYFRGSLPAGRINIGIPYYTRGWQGVTGGSNGLWGQAALPDQSQCPAGTGQGSSKCGYGAIGIDNMWHDLDENGVEMGAGSNPMWHAKNLESGILPSYLAEYGLDPATDPQDQLVGNYSRYYDSVAELPWLWNDQKDVFLSIEDEQSMAAKVQYVVDENIGGIMFWELAGDYTWHPSRNEGNGEYYMGSTLTALAYNMMRGATPYGNVQTERPMPNEAVELVVVVEGFKVGDQNYPINPKIKISNNSGVDLPGGSEFQFDIPTSTPDNAKDQSGAGLTVIESGHTANSNVGGLQGDFHRVAFSLPSWQTLAAGETYELDFVYYLPISGLSNYTVKINGTAYALAFEYPHLPLADLSSGGGGGGTGCAAMGVDPTIMVAYPDWPQGDHAAGGDRVRYNSAVYEANWWTNSMPGGDGSWTFVCGY